MPEPYKTSTHKPKHLEILDDKRQELFKDLAFTSRHGLYLAGGTALAFYLKHRTSIDFDFYSPEEFTKGALVTNFLQELTLYTPEVLRDINNTFDLVVDGINTSCFYYPYQLIRTANTLEGVQIAALEDIAAMKLIAIAQRGNSRDFVDLYYLIQKFGLNQLLGWTSKKYPAYNKITILKGLLFFKNAEETLGEETNRIAIFDQALDWKTVKDYIQHEVVCFQQN